VRVGLEQDGRRKEDVVDSDDPILVQLHVVHERRAAVQREVQRIVQVVIEVGAGGNDEVDEAAVHHLDDAAPHAGRGHCARDGQPDRRVVFRREHLARENLTSLGQAAGVERLEPVVNQPRDRRAALRTIVGDGLAGQRLRSRVPGRAWSTIRQWTLLRSVCKRLSGNSLTSGIMTGELGAPADLTWLWWTVAFAVAIVALLAVWVWSKGRRFTTGDVFRASRLSSGNRLFPTQVAITPTSVVHYTARWFGRREETIHMAHIASVKIETGMVFSDVLIETSGGAAPHPPSRGGEWGG